MPKTTCNSLRKDGEPCQGVGQPDLDGYCIAHAPAATAWEWRSRGGKASSSAARADKRIPDRLRNAIERVSQGMDDVLEGKLEPAALSAVCRGAKVLIELYRLADQEMEQIRSEETAVAAAQVAGASGNSAVLDEADDIAAWQSQYTINALIEQGLVAPEPVETHHSELPFAHVLTAAGRQRFGYQRLARHAQVNIDNWRELTSGPDDEERHSSAALYYLGMMRTDLEELLTDFAPASAPVLNPLTGQPFSQLPAAVIPAIVPVAAPGQAEQAAKEQQDLLRQATELFRELIITDEQAAGPPIENWEELEAAYKPDPELPQNPTSSLVSAILPGGESLSSLSQGE